MCTNGVNTGQFEDMLDQIDDHLGLEYRWVHKLAHRAGDGGFEGVSKALHSAQEQLAEARSYLDEAKQLLADGPDQGGAEVHLV